MRAFRGLAMLCGLAACVAGGMPDQTGYIEIASGGAFSGSSVTRVYADDRIEVQISGPFGAGREDSTRAGRPGLYQEMLALYRREAPDLARGLDREAPICPDYGMDSVRAAPPLPGVEGPAAGCPEPALQDFMGRMRALIAPR